MPVNSQPPPTAKKIFEIIWTTGENYTPTSPVYQYVSKLQSEYSKYVRNLPSEYGKSVTIEGAMEMRKKYKPNMKN